MDMIMSYCCGVLSTLLIGAIALIMRMKKDINNIQSDIIGLGGSFQNCIDGLTKQLNNHSDVLRQHQKAIDYLTKECDD